MISLLIGEIREVFVQMAECSYGCSGEGLTGTILESVSKVNLDMNFCRGQGYDGAGNHQFVLYFLFKMFSSCF